MVSNNHNHSTSFKAACIVYVCLIIAYLLAALFPQNRIWGLNLWAYFGTVLPWALFGGGMVLLIGSVWYTRRRDLSDGGSADLSDRVCWVACSGLIALTTLLFCLWRARTHFLGDGYTVLALLADPEPLVKTRELGEAMMHIWVKQLFGEGEPAALRSFQAISIGSGLAYLIALVLFARALFERNRDRLLFVVGLASGGYLYNFFGYVENYSLFVLMVSLYCLTGLLVARGRAPRWVMLPMAALAVLFHIFGVVLIPSTIYLLPAGTRWSRWIGRWPLKIKLLVIGGLAAASVAIFLNYYYSLFQLRFAIVPLWPDRFTVEGYHLFSLPHLIDFGNLLLLMAPSLPMVLALLFVGPLRKLRGSREYRYLLLLLICCCGALFVFDPRLGMPRDWDLFSFVGPPLAVTCFYFVLDPRVRSRHYAVVATLMTVLGVLILFPRAVSQTNPDLSVTWFNNYSELDKTKNMYGRTLLKKFYDGRGDAAASEREYKRYVTEYPEFTLNRQGISLKQEGKCVEALELFRKALEYNPTFVAVYANMGTCYRTLGQPDSAIAYLRIALGMNPYNWRVWNNLATAHFFKGDNRQAERCLLAARKYGPGQLDPLVGLVQVYKRSNHLDNWLKYLNLLVAHENAPLAAVTELAEYHLNQHRYAEAALLYRRAVGLGLDSAYVEDMRRDYPQLGL